jgi:hypothetical protein
MTKAHSSIQLRKISLGDLRCPHDTTISSMLRSRLAAAVAQFPMAIVRVMRSLSEIDLTLRAFEWKTCGAQVVDRGLLRYRPWSALLGRIRK